MFFLRSLSVLVVFWCSAGLIVKAQQREGTIYSFAETRIVQYGLTPSDSTRLLKVLNDNAALSVTDSEKNIAFFRNIAEQCRSINFNLGSAKAWNSIGHIYWNRNNYDEAAVAFRQSAYYGFLSTGIRGKDILCQAYNNLGNVYQYRGNFSQATAYYFKAAAIAAQYPEAITRVQLIYTNLGITEQQGSRALYYLNIADSISRKKNDMEILDFALLNKATIYEKTKEWALALKVLDEAYAISVNRKEPLMQYRALFCYASVYNAMNQPGKALEYVYRAEQCYPAGDNDSYQNDINYRIAGNIFLKLKHYEKAEIYLLKATRNAEKMQAGKNTAEAYSSLAMLYAAKGEHARAFQYQQMYMQLKDSLMNENIAQNVGQLEIRFRSAQKDKNLIRSQLEIANQNRQLLRKNIVIVGITAGGICLALVLSVLFLNSRRKQRFLLQQQEIEQLKAIMKGEEKERTRLARELHDGIGGMLAAIKMNVGSAIKDHPGEANVLKLSGIELLLADTATEVRKTAHNLMPDVLAKYGFVEAVSLYCSQINAGNKLHIELQFHGILELDKAIELILYRMVQELIQNVIKHAAASHVDIQVIRHENALHISVEDNGTGFDPEEQTTGSGLENLRFRIHALHGQIAVLSSKGKNTTIHIEFDLKKLIQSIHR